MKTFLMGLFIWFAFCSLSILSAWHCLETASARALSIHSSWQLSRKDLGKGGKGKGKQRGAFASKRVSLWLFRDKIENFVLPLKWRRRKGEICLIKFERNCETIKCFLSLEFSLFIFFLKRIKPPFMIIKKVNWKRLWRKLLLLLLTNWLHQVRNYWKKRNNKEDNAITFIIFWCKEPTELDARNLYHHNRRCSIYPIIISYFYGFPIQLCRAVYAFIELHNAEVSLF